MAPLTSRREKTRVLGHVERIHSLPLKATTQVYAGGIAMIDAGYGRPGGTALNLIAVGRWAQTVNNTGSAGAKEALAEEGTFLWDNSSAGDLITQADLFKDCYVVDDQTVAKTDGTGTRSRAGKIHKVTAEGVYVRMGVGI
jgi:hypothetical protein